ncbi:MAG: hypothetical protein ACI845_000540 [Gammaproteobacteria bacterium]|jgi:hypothetical protein
MSRQLTYYLCLLLLTLSAPVTSKADVVKPALIEINVFADSRIEIEIRVSLEALLTGINGRYRNTQESPKADQYDYLRNLSADELALEFKQFHRQLVDSLVIEADGIRLPLKVKEVIIPAPGYVKVPRNSVVYLHTNWRFLPGQIGWYYPNRFGDQAVRLRQIDEIKQQWHWSDYQWIRDDEFAAPFKLSELNQNYSVSAVVYTYIVAGIRHIVPLGLDHILFVLGLLLLASSLKSIAWQVTMFTFAHSITLGLASYRIIQLPASLVEPLIALSISYIAIENLLSSGLGSRRFIVVFLFGLLHGLGFATMLSEFGLPDNNFLVALLSFNLGVELGQLSILVIGWLLVFICFRNYDLRKKWIIRPASIMIGLTGLVWFIQRLDLDAIRSLII